MTGKSIEAFGQDRNGLDGEATKAAVREADAPTPVDLRLAYARIIEEAATMLEGVIPTNVNINHPHIPDSTVLPCDVTLGEFRAVAALAAKCREALKATPLIGLSQGEACDLCGGDGKNRNHQLWPDHPPACRACDGTGRARTTVLARGKGGVDNIEALFNECLNEHGPYYRNTPAQIAFGAIVGKLKADVLAALSGLSLPGRDERLVAALSLARDYICDTAAKDEDPDNWVIIRAIDTALEGSPPISGDAVDPNGLPRGLTASLEAAWTWFLDANPDDLTSPVEWPDHALVTCPQMIEIVETAFDRAGLLPSTPEQGK